MFACNVLLLASMAVAGAGLYSQSRTKGRDRPCTFLWGALFSLLFVVLPLMSNVLYGPARVPQAWNREWITDDQVYLIYGVGVLLFSLAYLAVSLPLLSGSSDERPSGDHDSRVLRTADRPRRGTLQVALGVVILLGFAVFVLGTGLTLGALLEGGRFVFYEQGTVNVPLVNLGRSMVGTVVVYAFLDARAAFPKRSLSALVYVAVLAFVVITGGRKWVLFVVSGMVAGSYDRRGELTFDWKGVLAFTTAVAIVVVWQVGRYVDISDPGAVTAITSRLADRLTLIIWEGDATYFYRASLEAIRTNVEHGLLYPFGIVRRLLLLPFPNEWTFGLKPRGIPLMFAEELQHYTEARGGNLPPGLLGTFTLSFGWWGGLVVGPIASLSGVSLMDRVVRRWRGWLRDVLFASFLMVALLLMRGTEGGFYFLAFDVATVGLIVWTVSAAGSLRATGPAGDIGSDAG